MLGRVIARVINLPPDILLSGWKLRIQQHALMQPMLDLFILHNPPPNPAISPIAQPPHRSLKTNLLSTSLTASSS